MGFLRSQNLSVAQPEVTHWESKSELSSTDSDIIVTLAALTFAVQLCLLLGFMLRNWRLDRKVAEALKHTGSAEKLAVPSTVFPDTYKQASYQLRDGDAAAASAPAASSSGDTYEQYETSGRSLFAPFLPWDLVQSG